MVASSEAKTQVSRNVRGDVPGIHGKPRVTGAPEPTLIAMIAKGQAFPKCLEQLRETLPDRLNISQGDIIKHILFHQRRLPCAKRMRRFPELRVYRYTPKSSILDGDVPPK